MNSKAKEILYIIIELTKDMKTYLISYDLSNKDKYKELFEKIKSYGKWAHITESYFAIGSDKPAKEIRDELLAIIGDDSRLMVVRSAHEAAWHNTLGTNEWLKKNL